MSASNWDEPLLRSMAVLQVKLQLLDQHEEQFTELSDMQAHRRNKSELAEYISAHARAGTAPADPLAELASRLRKLARFFAESGALHRTSVTSHQLFLQDDFPAISLSDLRQGQAELNEAMAQFPASLHSLAIQFSALDWSGNGAGPDIHPELLTCIQGLDIDFLLDAGARQDFRSLALGSGKLYQEVQSHFENVQSHLDQLVQLHTKHRDALQQAFAEVKQVNYLSAENLLTAAGLKQPQSERFSDLDYSVVTTSIAAFKRASDEASAFAKALPEACKKILYDFKVYYASRNRVSSYDRSNRQLATLRTTFEQHLTRAAALPGSELDIECRPSLEAVQPVLADAEAALNRMAVAGATSRRRFILTSATIIGVTVLIAILWGLYESRKRADIEAKAAVDRHVAVAKAITEREAAKEAQANAERIAADKARANAERAAAEAKTNAERTSAEAKTNAERAAAEAKTNAERAAAEAKANAERAAAEAKELQQRIKEAEDDLAKIQIQFQKPEAEYREARKVKEKQIAEILGNITATNTKLVEATNNDSAVQDYGTQLVDLLRSYSRRGEGDSPIHFKIPRSFLPTRILDRVLKAQVSTTSVGTEDMQNVKNYYFLSDFAFVNIPERDRYSRSERSTIDTLILKYLADEATYNAKRQTLIGQLKATLLHQEALSTIARAELDTIAKAEAVAREPLNRAQELVNELHRKLRL